MYRGGVKDIYIIQRGIFLDKENRDRLSLGYGWWYGDMVEEGGMFRDDGFTVLRLLVACDVDPNDREVLFHQWWG